MCNYIHICILVFSSPMVYHVTHTHKTVPLCEGVGTPVFMLYGQFMTQQFSKSGVHECNCFFIDAEVHSNKVSCSFHGQQICIGIFDKSNQGFYMAEGAEVWMPCNTIFSLVGNGICQACWAPCRAMVACRWALVSQGLWILVKMVAMPVQENGCFSRRRSYSLSFTSLTYSCGAKHSVQILVHTVREHALFFGNPILIARGLLTFATFFTCHTTLCRVQPRDPCACPLPWYNEWEHHLSD